jgi:hypothetical protein
LCELSSGWNAFQVLLQGDRASRWRLFENSSEPKHAVYSVFSLYFAFFTGLLFTHFSLLHLELPNGLP